MSRRKRRWTESTELALDEHDQGIWTDAIGLHRVGSHLRRHYLLKGIQIGNLDDQPDPIRLLGVDERTNSDPHWSENSLPGRCCEPVVNVIDFVKNHQCCHSYLGFPPLHRELT